MNQLARLLVPALRWDREHGFRYIEGLIDDALELGVGGFLVEGGPRDEAAALCGRLHSESRHPILVAAGAERGGGGAFTGLTELPALGAVASVAVVQAEGSARPSLDIDVVRRAARLAVRELKNVGANWALAPVCDLDVPGGNIDVGIRGAGSDPAVAGAVVAEWIDACQADAVLSCAMHFPGLGRAGRTRGTRRVVARGHGGDDALSLDESVAFLRANDFLPFASAIDAGVASVMVAPVAVPAFGATDGAMTSRTMVENVLRGELRFDGIVSTVPLDRASTISPATEVAAALDAVVAGCDVVLAPGDLSGVADALTRAAARGEPGAGRVREAIERVDRWAGWARPGAAREPSMDDVLWSRQLADRSVHWVLGRRPRVGGTIEVSVSGAAEHPAAASAFVTTLTAMHIAVAESDLPRSHERAPLAIVHAPSRGEPDGARRDAIAWMVREATAATDSGRDVVVVAACHPREAAAIAQSLGAPHAGAAPGDAPGDARRGPVSVLCAWDGSRPMLEAAARALVSPSVR